MIFTEEDFKALNCSPRWYVEAPVYCYSNVITDEAVEAWNEMANGIKLKKITERKIEVQFVLPELTNGNNLFIKATMLAISFVVSLNVGTFGHFWWAPPAWPFRFTKLFDFKNKINVQIKIQKQDDKQWSHKALTKQDMTRVAQVFSAITPLDETYFRLYSIGATLLETENRDFNFYTEVFSNFYRLIERFVKVEILKRKKGDLNLKIIKKVLSSLSIDQDIVNVLDGLTQVRSRDAMHAYGIEKEITFEEAGKCKILCDLMLFKFTEQEFDKYDPAIQNAGL